MAGAFISDALIQRPRLSMSYIWMYNLLPRPEMRNRNSIVDRMTEIPFFFQVPEQRNLNLSSCPWRFQFNLLRVFELVAERTAHYMHYARQLTPNGQTNRITSI